MIYDLKFNFKTMIAGEIVDCMYCIRPHKEIGYHIMCKRRDTDEMIFNKAFRRKQETSSGRKAYAKLRDYAIDKVEEYIR